ncbi:thiamine phosphate synthase [Ferrigenium sp. UT5]|uniref:thiamine phosphate synthase n=1 Tax=Ferrigenium sp. UT5 TaxID=3242105 RepID=UPI0035505499
MLARRAVHGLYAITPDEPDTAVLLRKARLALQGGAQILQYRNKTADAGLQTRQAQALRQLTREFNATFIVNDDPGLAAAADADGVHLGGDDGSVPAARALLGEAGIVGVSCYNRAPLAFAAAQQGADYVAFGAFFASAVKPGALQAEVPMLRAARTGLNVPIVAIGGITLQNGAALIEAGADALAVISALWNAPDIERTARKFSTLFSKASS